jgi:S-adenosylmethionine decarboxylase
MHEDALGHHILIDLWGVPHRLLDDTAALERELVEAARAGGAHVVERRMHRFAPHGVSGVLILAESHLAVHTWPEADFAAVDVFTCGPETIAEAVAREIVERLGPSTHRTTRVDRGASSLPAAAGATR